MLTIRHKAIRSYQAMIIAITGGIGSGKSYVCKLLQSYQISVYDCDAAAKHLMRTSSSLQRQLSQLVGVDLFPGGILQKAPLAQYLLASPGNALAVDEIIHPMVAQHFLASGQEWIESAILFDSKFDERIHPDKVVCVTAPLSVRLHRIMHRDRISEAKAQAWINRQLPQEEVVRRSHYEIVNDGNMPLRPQIENILNQIK